MIDIKKDKVMKCRESESRDIDICTSVRIRMLSLESFSY